MLSFCTSLGLVHYKRIYRALFSFTMKTPREQNTRINSQEKTIFADK